MSFGLSNSRASARRLVEKALDSAPYISPSNEILDLNRLPSKIQDRTWDLKFNQVSSRGATYSDTTEVQYEFTITYAKLVSKTNQRFSTLVADEDLDTIYRHLMSYQDLKNLEIAFISESEPVFTDDGLAIIHTQTYTLITRRSHS